MIDLYYWPTPNGHKITIFLEEAGLEYKADPVESRFISSSQARFCFTSPRKPAN
jgi:GST-like protein